MIARLLRKIFFLHRKDMHERADSLEPAASEGAAFKRQGDAFLKAGNLAEAEQAYREAIARNPGDARSHFTLGYALHEQGESAEAASQLHAALSIDPNLVDAHYVLGTIHQAESRTEAAIAQFRQVLELDPANDFARRDLCLAYGQRAKLLREGGRSEEALACYDRLIALSPDTAEFHFERGSLLLALERPAEALTSFDRVTVLVPGLASAHSNKALALTALDRHEEALISIDRALEIAPDFTAAQVSRVTLLLDLGRHYEALEGCARALRGNPDQPSLLNCRGIALHELRRSKDALSAYDSALRLKPDYPAALINRSDALLGLNRFDESLADLERAQKLAPDLADIYLADIYFARGNVLQEQVRHEEALKCFARALELRPGFEDAHVSEGVSRLSLGDFERGWQEYEHRWKCRGWKNSQGLRGSRNLRSPVWLGQEPPAGKTILLHAEQGIGDTIQFSRYALPLSNMGAKVLLEVQQPLKELLRDLQGVRCIYAEGEQLPHYDFHCPLLSLPLACKTLVDSIPSPGPYLGTSFRHRAKLDQWKAKLGAKTRKRIGLAWSGNPWHRNDANRSICFSDIARIISKDFEFCCLQNELRESDREAALHNRSILFLCEFLTDFSETAGLVGNMDLVICIDTSIAHLAGALGIPVWLLLPANPDFRWLVGREDSPWYASMRLIRQRRLGSWDSEMTQLRRDLELLPKGTA